MGAVGLIGTLGNCCGPHFSEPTQVCVQMSRTLQATDGAHGGSRHHDLGEVLF